MKSALILRQLVLLFALAGGPPLSVARAAFPPGYPSTQYEGILLRATGAGPSDDIQGEIRFAWAVHPTLKPGPRDPAQHFIALAWVELTTGGRGYWLLKGTADADATSVDLEGPSSEGFDPFSRGKFTLDWSTGSLALEARFARSHVTATLDPTARPGIAPVTLTQKSVHYPAGTTFGLLEIEGAGGDYRYLNYIFDPTRGGRVEFPFGEPAVGQRGEHPGGFAGARELHSASQILVTQSSGRTSLYFYGRISPPAFRKDVQPLTGNFVWTESTRRGVPETVVENLSFPAGPAACADTVK